MFDGISAALVKRGGFAAAYMTGAGVSAAGFGLPDIGLLTQTEMVERVRMIASVLADIPLIGALFRSNEISDSRKELLIFVTPRVVQQTPSAS